MRLLVDMNLAPKWCEVLRSKGFDAVHWSTVGAPSASDAFIMQWARQNGYVVLTHDLDFGALLATTGLRGPSVVQIRTQDVLSEAFQETILRALRQFEAQLEAGALITVDATTARARILPFAG